MLKTLQRIAVWVTFVCAIYFAVGAGWQVGIDPISRVIFIVGFLGVIVIVQRLFEVIDSIPEALGRLTDEIVAVKESAASIEDRLAGSLPNMIERWKEAFEQARGGPLPPSETV